LDGFVPRDVHLANEENVQKHLPLPDIHHGHGVHHQLGCSSFVGHLRRSLNGKL
jgi:hypothetical protein